MAAATDQEFYACPICGKTSQTKTGISTHRAAHSTGERKQALRETLQAVAGDNETVTQEVFFGQTQYGIGSVKSVYGSWEQALLAAGLTPSHRRQISDDEILADLCRVADKHGGTVTLHQYTGEGICAPNTVIDRFGSWQNAVRQAGVSSDNHILSNSELLKDFKDVVDDCEEKLTKTEFNRRSEHSYVTYLNRFGTWESVFEEVGVDPDAYLAPRTTGETRDRYGPRWNLHRRQVRDRDNNACRVCGAPGSETKLHVHHICPARQFTAYTEMNDHSNLITLCPSCHRTFEGNWQSASPATFTRLAQTTRPDKAPRPLPASETADPVDPSTLPSRSRQITLESFTGSEG